MNDIVNSPAPSESAGLPANAHWLELDLFRAVAATFMILNHVAVTSLSIATSPLIGASERLGGFAPVLFYFATGVGSGIQSVGRGPGRGLGFLAKVAILLAADSDFFTFIGLSMLVLEILRRLPRPVASASVLAALAIGARFLVAPILRSRIERSPSLKLLGDFLGITDGFGYPLGPWLAYPMLGFLVGRFAAGRRVTIAARRWLVAELLMVAAPFAIAAAVMVARGAVLHRYGTMSFAYFLASLAVLPAAMAICVLVARVYPPGLADRISLSGLRSFAVVPLQYLLIGLLVQAIGAPSGGFEFSADFLLVLAVSFVVSALFVRGVGVLTAATGRKIAWGLVLGALLAYWGWLRGSTTGLALVTSRSSLQLALCLGLSIRGR